MKLLLVVATADEIKSLLGYYNLPGEGLMVTEKFDVLITGVGMTATAFSLGKYLGNNYSLVLNIGIAGSFDQELKLGSLVQVENDVFAELGAEDHDKFITIDELGFGKNSYSSSYHIETIPKVKSITVNKVHGNAKSIELVRHRFSPQTESMEGAAVFYACENNNIKVLQIRTISNYVVPRAKEDWQIGLAIKNLNDWAIDFIENYKA